MARPSFDWQAAAVAYRQAEELRQAVLEDAELAPAGLTELIRRDAAARPTSQEQTTTQRALPAGAPPVDFAINLKEDRSNVPAPRSFRQR